MDEYPYKHRDLDDGRAYLAMQKRKLPVKLIAEIAGVTEAEVLRLIELAKRPEK